MLSANWFMYEIGGGGCAGSGPVSAGAGGRLATAETRAMLFSTVRTR